MIPVSERVVQNARECLAILEDDFQLDMSGFIIAISNSDHERIIKGRVEGEDVNICGTSFCIAGWQAFKEGYPKEYRDRHSVFFNPWFDHYSFALSKVDDNDIVWEFFYSGNWPNDREYAKERMKFVIENKAIPESYNYGHCNFTFKGFPWRRS